MRFSAVPRAAEAHFSAPKSPGEPILRRPMRRLEALLTAALMLAAVRPGVPLGQKP